MKNFTLLLVATLSLSVAYGQNTGERSAQSRSVIPLYDSIYNWTLDTANMVWGYNNKEIGMAYDANNNLVSDVDKTWNGSTWVDSSQTTYTYAGNLITSKVYQTWNGSNWVNGYQYTWTYNANNDMTGKTYQTGNGSSWVNKYQYTRLYNSSNDDTSELYQTGSGSSWVNSYQHSYTYNSNNDMTSEVYKKWNGSAWADSTWATWYYNSNNLVDSDLYQTWYNGGWQDSARNIYTYNSNNLVASDSSGFWNSLDGWAAHLKFLYTYNADNELTDNENEGWSTFNYWVPYDQSLYTYNSDYKLTSDKFQEWFMGIGFVTDFQDTIIYNSNNDPTNVTSMAGGYTISRSTYTYDANNVNESEADRNFSNSGTTITNADSIYWYYHKTAEGINLLSLNSKQLSVYPNPSNNFIHASIQLKQTENLQLRLVNMLGQTVWVTDAGTVNNYQTNISVANLPDGVYLLEMVTGSGTESREVVVQK